MAANIVKQILARPIQLADQSTKVADEAQSFKMDCAEVKLKTEKLAALLRQAARASNDLYERPTRRIIDETEQVLEKTLTLVMKCRAGGIMKRLFTIIPAGTFRKTLIQLENSIGDVSWLLRVSASSTDRDDEYLGLPPIAANEPILCLIWEQIAILHTGTLEERSDAAASLVSLARDNDRYGKLIIEEGGVPALLKLAKEGRMEGQENAVRAIGLLGRDPESVESIVNTNICTVFSKILKEGHMKVQTIVAWSISELAGNHPKCQDHFAQSNAIRLLVGHLAFETIQEHSKYAIPTRSSSLHSVMIQNQNQNQDPDQSQVLRPTQNQAQAQIQNVVTNTLSIKQQQQQQQQTRPPLHQQSKNNITKKHNHNHPQHQHHQGVSLTGTSIKGRDMEDPQTKAEMKAMAARALWQLSKGNAAICTSITESRALLCFAVLLEKGPDEVQSYSAMALMEITAVAEETSDLRRSAFKPTSPSAKAVLDQLLKIIETPESTLLAPCVISIGNLARTFRATETRIIGPLVRLLDEREPEISMEAAISLNKFACTENYLHASHSQSILDHGGVKHLIQLIYFGEQMVQVPSLILLCYVATHVPDNETLAQEEVLIVFEWATKQGHLISDPTVDMLLPEAKSRLELYQSRGTRGLVY